MKKTYEALSVDVVKFEAQDVITVSNPNQDPTEAQGGNNNPDSNGSNPGIGQL